MLDHVADLALHCEDKEDDKVDEEDGPEDGNVKHLEPGHDKRDRRRLHCLVPKLELGDAPSEGLRWGGEWCACGRGGG